MKKDYQSLWVVYSHEEASASEGAAKVDDEYTVVGAFPAQPRPSSEQISNLFTGR